MIFMKEDLAVNLKQQKKYRLRRIAVVVLALTLFLGSAYYTGTALASRAFRQPVQPASSSSHQPAGLGNSSSMPQENPPAPPQNSSQASPSSQSTAQSSSESETTASDTCPPQEQTDPFADIYTPETDFQELDPQDKVAYLTFDDGPSELTLPLLDILDQYGVKATFFDIGRTDDASKKAMRETVRRGHTLGVHSYTHDYKQIYASKDAFLEDFSKEFRLIRDTTGVSPSIYRFAGGSVNSFNHPVIGSIVQEMKNRGFVYYDWNVSSGDASGKNYSSEQIASNILKGCQGHNRAIILCHNSKPKRATLEAMPTVIEELKAQGYRFAALDESVLPIKFKLPE